MTTDAVVDAGDATFAAEVIERSSELPVIVDFWAPWCGPCRVIGPVLEGLAEEYAGKVQLVKVNVDESPQVASQYRIESIPAVMAFRDGGPAGGFIGAVPEPQARGLFESLVPSEADDLASQGDDALVSSDPELARSRYEAALAIDPRHEAATLGLAAIAFDAGDLERAAHYAAAAPTDVRARRLLSLIGFRLRAGDADRASLEATLAVDGNDAQAHYTLGNVLAAAEEWEGALDHMLETVRLDRSLDDDGGRQRMLELFEILGEERETTREYRSRLANLLF